MDPYKAHEISSESKGHNLLPGLAPCAYHAALSSQSLLQLAHIYLAAPESFWALRLFPIYLSLPFQFQLEITYIDLFQLTTIGMTKS